MSKILFDLSNPDFTEDYIASDISNMFTECGILLQDVTKILYPGKILTVKNDVCLKSFEYSSDDGFNFMEILNCVIKSYNKSCSDDMAEYINYGCNIQSIGSKNLVIDSFMLYTDTGIVVTTCCYR